MQVSHLRAACVSLLVVASACGSKKAKDAPKVEPQGSGSAVAAGSGSGSGASAGSGSATAAGSGSAAPIKAPVLTWTTPAGEPLLALAATGDITGPCGRVGGTTATEVVIDGQKFVWTGVDRKGRTYQVAPLPWTIEVGAAGEVSLNQPGKPSVPLGKVVGVDTEEGATWFKALVIAAPALQIKLGFDSTDGKVTYTLAGSADLDAWTVKQGATVIAKKPRDQAHAALATDAADGLDPQALSVAATAPGTYAVKIAGAQKAYGATAYQVTEAEDGALRWKPDGAKAPLPLGTLTGRARCKPHDLGVAALVEIFLSTKAGFAATREAEQKWFGKK